MIAQQLDLVDFVREHVRRSDPHTSREAAGRLLASGSLCRQKSAVYDALLKWGPRSSRGLANASGMDRHMVARRLPDLERDGTAEKVPLLVNGNFVYKDGKPVYATSPTGVLWRVKKS